VIAGRSTTGGRNYFITSFANRRNSEYTTVHSLPRLHRAAQSMEPDRDSAAMVGREGPKRHPKKKAFRVPSSLSSRTLGPALARGSPALPPKTSLQGVLGSSRFVSVRKRKHTSFL